MQPQAQVPQSYIIEGYHTHSLSLVIYIAKQTKQHYNRKRTQSEREGSYSHKEKNFQRSESKKELFFSFLLISCVSEFIDKPEMTTMLTNEHGLSLNLKETELCLGLPGGGSEVETPRATGKRGFSETVDLKLNLHSKEDLNENLKNVSKEKTLLKDPAKPPAK